MSAPEAPQITWDGNVCVVVFPDNSRIKVVKPSADLHNRIWGQVQAYQGDNLINDRRKIIILAVDPDRLRKNTRFTPAPFRWLGNIQSFA